MRILYYSHLIFLKKVTIIYTGALITRPKSKYAKPRKVIVNMGKDVCVSCRLFLFHKEEGACYGINIFTKCEMDGKQESGENLIITNSSIGMESARTYTSVSKDAYLRSRSVTTMSAKDFMDSLNSTYQSIHEKKESDTKEEVEGKEKADNLSGNAEDSLEYLKGKFNEIATTKAASSSKLDEDLRSAIRYMCLNFLLMIILGKNGAKEFNKKQSDFLGLSNFSDQEMGFTSLNSLSSGNLEFTKITDSETYEHYEAEFEGTSFSATGVVKTSDGRELDFNIDITMSRSFEKYTRETGTYESFGMKLMDPLIINLDTCAAEVSDQKFYFDIDSDGIEDQIATLSSNSGYLALDLNEDGKINNGTELFGTKSGDGFKDLMQYDSDRNGWIDEADEVYDKLRIFCINDDGTTSQYSLKEKGVGAIYLGSKETDFSVTNQENRINAQIRKTGMFLYETGGVGTIQHVDLSVELGA